MNLESARKRYKGEWIAFKFLNKEKKAGRVLFHAKEKQAFNTMLKDFNGKIDGLYLFRAAPLVPPGTSIVVGPILC